jgi:hypothetical protein
VEVLELLFQYAQTVLLAAQVMFLELVYQQLSAQPAA